MEKDLTSLEILGIAIRSEEEAARFYGHIARRIGNELVRTRFRHLAEEEGEHRKMLFALYRQLTGDPHGPPRVVGGGDLAEGAPVSDEHGNDSLESLLELAVQREEHARDFYRKAAENAMDPSGERILHYLADVEEGHAQRLKRELHAFHRDTAWYTGQEAPEMVHLGP
jgi:rubrerythrin